MKLFLFAMIFALTSVLTVRDIAFAQGQPYSGPDDPAGDVAAEREGYMTGNRVFLYFRNTTELSDWPKSDVSRWPNNYDGVKMLDGIALLIGAKVYIKNTPSPVDTIPVTNPLYIKNYPDSVHTLYYLQTSYREEMDRDPITGAEWGIYPVFGYFNENNEYPAMSNLPDSWPPSGWPAPNGMTIWPGEWNGRFGRGVIYADLETFFVANDAQDQEYLGIEDRARYYPRPGKKIGDIRPAVTIQKGKPWGGIGIRVAQRGFQWNNPQARDAIFWEYNIANISDYDLTEVAFGYWVDNGIGDDGTDELGYFDKYVDMAYSWDINGVGLAGRPTGTMGFAYLESPGLAYDNEDNDDDGIIDEKRDNPATRIVGPTEGIYDVQKFLAFYNYKLEDLKDHWDSDEDGDWMDGDDVNGDGIYQVTEDPGDDVGLDGVGPGEINYNGPDEGECNHKPDFIEGMGCEPNYDATDVSESDMLGLTAFRLFPVPSHASSYRWFRGDDSMWELIGSDSLVEFSGNISNLIEVFASGAFPLYKGRTERISMSELHSYDNLAGLNSTEHSAPALYEQKRIVQVIYEKDYRFAQPPRMPTLQATAGDGQVVLTWNDVSDTKTRDPFLRNVNDFEGYKLYRATDKKMSDPEVITDGYGTPMFKKPIFQCDLKDEKRGFTNFGLVNGMGYYLGEDSGVLHHFVDNTVQNGRTYYYALVAYDYGAPDIGGGISPSENNVVIELEETTEEVRSVGINVQVVTPHQKAAGYVPPSIKINSDNYVRGSGIIEPEILSSSSTKPGHTYKIKFGLDTLYAVKDHDHGMLYTNNTIEVYDVSENNSLVYRESPEKYAYDNIIYQDTLDFYYFKSPKPFTTDVFDGIRLNITMPVVVAEVDTRNSGWLTGRAPINITPTKTEMYYFPWDYEIVFTGQDSAYVGRATSKNFIKDENDQRFRNSAELLTGQAFGFYVQNKSFLDSTGNYEKMDMVVHDQNNNGVFDIMEDRILVGALNNNGIWAGTVFIIDFKNAGSTENLPQNDDVFRLTFQRPFWSEDSIMFTPTAAGELNVAELKNTLDKIKVVPNPYVATNTMETAVGNPYLNQRRRIMFTHLPSRCIIKIFTASGVLVDQIDVNNAADNGIAHWDLLTKEGLEVAAGIYIYHIKVLETGDEKMGKFAIIK
ncbi:MAG: hypothetical protein P8184_14935 [Calditrichia bacterium]